MNGETKVGDLNSEFCCGIFLWICEFSWKEYIDYYFSWYICRLKFHFQLKFQEIH